MAQASGGGGSIVKLASGSLAGITLAAPQSIDVRNYAGANQFSNFTLRLKNIAAASGTAAVALRIRLMKAGAAYTTANYVQGAAGGRLGTTGAFWALNQSTGGGGALLNGKIDITLQGLYEAKYVVGDYKGTVIRNGFPDANVDGRAELLAMQVLDTFDGFNLIADVNTQPLNCDWEFYGNM